STVPAYGMQRLPEQLAADLSPGVIRFESSVELVHSRGVVADGREISARAVVVATDAWTAAELVPAVGPPPASRGVTTYYHAADPWPGQSPTLLIDARPSGPANSIVLTAAAPEYSGDGRSLISTSVVHDGEDRGPGADQIRADLAELHGRDTSQWELVGTYVIPQALPAMTAPHPLVRPASAGGVFLAGDHRATSSIQGAVVSGRRAADAVTAAFAAG
ncbi:MAG: putative oxidoreductase, partial [Marmoricola sp.]|nr:putative oxidoreductase [Marmoricola sp.]